MAQANAGNERIKRDYFRLLKEGRGYDEASIDGVAQALNRFETYTRHRPFDRFHIEQAIGFKRWLPEQKNQATGKPLSKATLLSTMRVLRDFFLWLAGQPGFRSRISFGDAGYFRLSEKETRAAQRAVERPVPTLEQIEAVLASMPVETPLQRRDRAVVAFTLLIGARDSAIASLRLRHVDVQDRLVFQDPLVVRTKASKAIRTWFFPIGGSAEHIVLEWVRELRNEHKWGEDDALFPPTKVGFDEERQFAAAGFERSTWNTADPIRKIFRRAFTAAGLPYHNPHSFRKTLALLGERTCHTAEQFKAWSQNLGHEQTLTTFTSYGTIPAHRQGEIMKTFPARDKGSSQPELTALLAKAGLKLTHI